MSDAEKRQRIVVPPCWCADLRDAGGPADVRCPACLAADVTALRAQLAEREQELSALRVAAKSQAWQMAQQAEAVALNLHARYSAEAALAEREQNCLCTAEARQFHAALKADYELLDAKCAAARAALGRLRLYLYHHEDCASRVPTLTLREAERWAWSAARPREASACTCGLDDLLAGVADPVPAAAKE